jgi:hypothetical protein
VGASFLSAVNAEEVHRSKKFEDPNKEDEGR